MKELMIATSNLHKVEEFKAMLEPLGYHVKSLLDIEERIEIDETGTTFEENALIKARAIHKAFGGEVIADDSGFAVNHLQGAPGIYSARFLGKDAAYEEKNQYIIDALKDASDRGCQYICAIAHISCDGKEQVFTGVLEGTVSYESIGNRGFGYDPIFYYKEFGTTLANVEEDEKNRVSHRALALKQVLAYLERRS